MSRFRVGLTGGLASGKSAAAGFFAAQGVCIADADRIVAELTAPGGAALPILAAQVGQWVLTADGAYNKPAVREKIFRRPELRAQVEAVLHPLVRQQLRAELAAAASPYAIGVIPLLLESGGEWERYFDRIITVECGRQRQIERARRRDGKDDACRIIAAQTSDAARRRRADDVIDNSGDMPALEAAVDRLHRQLLAAAAAAAE